MILNSIERRPLPGKRNCRLPFPYRNKTNGPPYIVVRFIRRQADTAIRIFFILIGKTCG